MIINIRERNFRMLKQDLILRNPLRLLGQSKEDIVEAGQFGAVLARAGLGKTALLVQLALDSLLRSKNVLHISLRDSVQKVCLWYEEVFRNIANQYDIRQLDQLWEAILPHRFIMTFKVESFNASIVEDRLSDIAEQDIFYPQMVLIDGLPFENIEEDFLADFKKMAEKFSVPVWFAVLTHRHEPCDNEGTPAVFSNISHLFENAIQLLPDGEQVFLKLIKGRTTDSDAIKLYLDPSTMLIQNTTMETGSLCSNS